MTTASWRRCEPNVAVHMPALPSSFLLPGVSLLSILMGTMSEAQVYADLYIGQNAFFPVTGLPGPESPLDSPLGGSEHAVRRRTARLTTAPRKLIRIPLPRIATQFVGTILCQLARAEHIFAVFCLMIRRPP